ncbi:MAG: ABC transporter substrate-binding protein [Chloroflexota bacterium]|nr:ABC transporter substrate-binding protein [Chloroflexota bacterium]
MSRERELAGAYLAGRIHRRDLIRVATAMGASLPLTTLLIACGGNAAPTATAAVTAAKPTVVSSVTSAATAVVGSAPAATTGPVVTGATTAPQSGAATQTSSGAPKSGGTLVWSYPVSVADTLNQHTSNFTPSRMIARHVLDCLTAVDPKTGEIKPWLAKSWEISSDGLQYTFHLRDGVKFHDGTPFNAAAVKANFALSMDPQTKHAFAYQALGGDKYGTTETVDDMTVKVTFKKAHAAFLAYLSDGGTGIDSPDALKKYGADYGIKALVGTGPFKFVEWVKGDHVTMTRNPDYQWGAPIFKHQGPAYLDKLTFRDIAENATRAAALASGDVQAATLSEVLVAQFQGSKDVQILTVPKAGTTRMYLMNTAKAPTDDIQVRQAINMAVDKAGLIKLPAWSGIGKPGVAPLPSNMVPNGDLSSLKQYDIPFDAAKANALLDSAGWAMGSGNIRAKGGQQLTLDMVAQASDLPFIEPLGGMLSKVGIKMNIRSGDFNFWIDTVGKKEFTITLFSDSGYDSAGLMEEFFYSKAPYNSWGVNDPALDTLIEAAVNAPTRDDIWKNLFPAMGMVMQKAVGVMAWEQLYVYGARSNVQDVGFNEIGFPYFYDTWLK